jgi:hypothetical protein
MCSCGLGVRILIQFNETSLGEMVVALHYGKGGFVEVGGGNQI